MSNTFKDQLFGPEPFLFSIYALFILLFTFAYFYNRRNNVFIFEKQEYQFRKQAIYSLLFALLIFFILIMLPAFVWVPFKMTSP